MVNDLLGGRYSARILMYSIEFGDFSKQEVLASDGDWDKLLEIMIDAAQRLEGGGADFIVICSNTMHSAVDSIEDNVGIPVLHIADATAEAVVEEGITTVALLGTKYTVFNELCEGVLKDTSRQQLVAIIDRLVGGGAEGVILGCTELPLLIGQKDVGVPLFDTMRIHAAAAALYSLE
jgi:aspartate racemase